MTDGTWALALGAGMLAAVNPCGFALLPAYLTLLVGTGTPGDRRSAVGRALVLTAAMTCGFIAVFGIFGLVISPLAAGLQQHLPWVTLVVGALLLVAGSWLLAGRALPAFGWSPQGKPPQRTALSMAGFGASYATASLTCTIGPFLAIVVSSFRAASVLEGVVLFVAYGLGMGLVVGIAAVGVALAQSSLVGALRRSGRWAPRIAGVVMIVVGAYVGYYGWWELRVLRGGATDDPVIEAASTVQQVLSSGVRAIGPGWLTVVLAVLIGAAVLAGMRRRRRIRSAAGRQRS